MFRSLVVIAAVTAMALSVQAAAKTVTIGHFGDPTPTQIAATESRFEKATGWDIEWRKFNSGAE